MRIYEWNGSAWVQVGLDIDGDVTSERSGYSVSISSDGSRVAIGAIQASSGGRVRIHEWNGSTWVQIGQDIGGEGGGANSGWSVSLSGDGSRVAIGDPYNSEYGFWAGQVRVYDLNFSGTEIVPQNKHTLINSKTISSGVHDEIVGGIQLSAGDTVLVSSPSGDVVFNMYGVETL